MLKHYVRESARIGYVLLTSGLLGGESAVLQKELYNNESLCKFIQRTRTECSGLSSCSKTHRVSPGIVTVQCDFLPRSFDTLKYGHFVSAKVSATLATQ
jgi:hypothetical protein